jgi:TonB family protein
MKSVRRLIWQTVAFTSVITFLTACGAVWAQSLPNQNSEPVYELRDVATAPKGTYMPNPDFTDKARQKKMNGSVVVEMVVTAKGKVRDIKVVKSLDPGLDKQALAAVKQWEFKPATKDGQPVAVHLTAEVDFRVY